MRVVFLSRTPPRAAHWVASLAFHENHLWFWGRPMKVVNHKQFWPSRPTNLNDKLWPLISLILIWWSLSTSHRRKAQEISHDEGSILSSSPATHRFLCGIAYHPGKPLPGQGAPDAGGFSRAVFDSGSLILCPPMCYTRTTCSEGSPHAWNVLLYCSPFPHNFFLLSRNNLADKCLCPGYVWQLTVLSLWEILMLHWHGVKYSLVVYSDTVVCHWGPTLSIRLSFCHPLPPPTSSTC